MYIYHITIKIFSLSSIYSTYYMIIFAVHQEENMKGHR